MREAPRAERPPYVLRAFSALAHGLFCRSRDDIAGRGDEMIRRAYYVIPPPRAATYPSRADAYER